MIARDWKGRVIADKRPVFWYAATHVASGDSFDCSVRAIDRAEFDKLIRMWNTLSSPGGAGWIYETITGPTPQGEK